MTAAIHPFDLQARAELATHALTALLDAEREGLMYFLADWRSRPPRADHSLWDCGDGSGRHVDALALARSMVRQGSPAAAPAQGDAQLEGWMLRLLGEDGLSWLSAEPWAEPWGKDFLMAKWQAGQPAVEVSWAQRATLMGLVGRFLKTAEERYLTCACRLIDALRRIAVPHADGLFFPEGYYQPSGWGWREAGLAPGIEEYNAVLIVPALRLYQASGYGPALELVEGLVRFALKHTAGYNPDGSFCTAHHSLVEMAHFHTRTIFIQGVLKLGLVLGRREYVAWARQSYEHAKTWGTEFGWFPEHLGNRHAEICGIVDMIEIALLLAQHVDRRYYADAERFGRNHLLQSQHLSRERLQETLGRLPPSEGTPPYGGRYSTTEDVVGRQVGGFAARPGLNDTFHRDATDMMQCCNASGTRGLYDLWRYAVEEMPSAEGGPRQMAVHLRFSVETLGLRVVSYEPATGRLDIRAKRASEVMVRLPTGTSQALLISGGEQARRGQALTAQDGYIRFPLAAEERAEVHYALAERAAQYEVGRAGRVARCTGYWRGEIMVGVEPQGQYGPLYGGLTELGPVKPALPAGNPIPSL